MIQQINYSLRSHNTFGIEATADLYFEYTSVKELKEALGIWHNRHAELPALHIGQGSNLLFTGDYHGVVFHSTIGGIDEISFSADEVTLRVGAGVVWDDFVAYCVEHGYGGVENLSLIPGEVGASAIQNIGAYGVEARDVIFKVEAVEMATGRDVTFSKDDCHYAYRDSIFKHELKGQYAITYVLFRMPRTFVPRLDYGNIRAELSKPEYQGKADMQTLRRAIINIRQAKLPDPKILGNAGSFFMNPVVPREKYESLAARYPGMPHYDVDDDHIKIPAGWMIEQCGWKGKSQGRAAVHDKQALVLVNLGGATSAEIVALSRSVCEDVKNKFGIEIHPEVNFI
jgi:UDP-N-acetylmuramate dehydrogenase